MRGPARRSELALAACVLGASVLGASVLGACAVERPGDLESRLWICDVSSDCLDGWACADGSVLAGDFCRPACGAEGASCDGICTRTGECLATCTLLGDETTACPAGHSCLRTDLLGDEGVCFPAASCSRSDECGAGTRCFNDVFQLPSILPGVEYASDQLYCVAVPDDMDRCASGYVLVPSFGVEREALCLPRCDTEGSRCPPDLTCLRELGYLFAQPGVSPCYPGYWGLPCDDDAQCMVGRCLEIGEGRRACTYSCADADRTFGAPGGGCDTLEGTTRGLRLDALDVRCERVAGQDVCVPLGTAGAPCNDDTLCAPGLECRVFSSGESRLRFCSRDCESDQECNTEGVAITAYCQRDATGGSCVPRSFEGGGCARLEQCRPGLVCEGGMCVAGPEV
ncbi:MAG: hypothetical protein M3Y87_02270 [Myxococcota bacterium]|nr:hypothetical protein [Myxococcota bacterium]